MNLNQLMKFDENAHYFAAACGTTLLPKTDNDEHGVRQPDNVPHLTCTMHMRNIHVYTHFVCEMLLTRLATNNSCVAHEAEEQQSSWN